MNKKVILNYEVGDMVLLNVPPVDKGPLDPNNLICYITDKKRDGLFQLGCKAGIFNVYWAINSFEKTDLVVAFKMEDIPLAKDKKGNKTGEYVSVSVREAVKLLSVGNGQGYMRCNCAGLCATMKCSCRSAGLTCSSKCHAKALTCKNS